MWDKFSSMGAKKWPCDAKSDPLQLANTLQL